MKAWTIWRRAIGAAAVSLISSFLHAAGWVYAEMTTEDTLALRGLSLQLQSIQAHLEAARIEEFLDLKPSLRFPHFYEVPPISCCSCSVPCYATATLYVSSSYVNRNHDPPDPSSIPEPMQVNLELSQQAMRYHDQEMYMLCSQSRFAHTGSLAHSGSLLGEAGAGSTITW